MHEAISRQSSFICLNGSSLATTRITNSKMNIKIVNFQLYQYNNHEPQILFSPEHSGIGWDTQCSRSSGQLFDYRCNICRSDRVIRTSVPFVSSAASLMQPSVSDHFCNQCTDRLFASSCHKKDSLTFQKNEISSSGCVMASVWQQRSWTWELKLYVASPSTCN